MKIAFSDKSPCAHTGASFTPPISGQNWNFYMAACSWWVTVWPTHSMALPREQHPAQDSEMTAKPLWWGPVWLTSCSQVFCTAVPMGSGLSISTCHASPVTPIGTAGASMGKTRGRRCQWEAQTCWSPAPAPKACTKAWAICTAHTISRAPDSSLLHLGILAVTGLSCIGFNPFGKFILLLHLKHIWREEGWLAGCFPACAWCAESKAAVSCDSPCAPDPAPPLGLQLSTDSTFWLQHSSDCHLHASQAHGELGHPGQEECVIRDDGVNSNPHETSLASTCSRNQI